MEAQELFRRLGAGARFDVRRFGIDARRFGVRSTPGEGGKLGRVWVTFPPVIAADGPRPFPAAGPRAYLRLCGSGRGGAGIRAGCLTVFPNFFPLQVIKGSGGVSPESLDFFGCKEEAPLGSAEEGWRLVGAGEEVKGGEQQKEDGARKNSGEVAGKRKRTAESSEGKRKKKKARGIYVHVCMSLAEYADQVRVACFGLL